MYFIGTTENKLNRGLAIQLTVGFKGSFYGPTIFFPFSTPVPNINSIKQNYHNEKLTKSMLICHLDFQRESKKKKNSISILKLLLESK